MFTTLFVFRLPQPGSHRPRGEGEQRERHLGGDQRPHQPLLQVTMGDITHIGGLLTSGIHCDYDDMCFQFDRDCERQCGGADLQRQQQRGGAHRGEEFQLYAMFNVFHIYAVQVSYSCPCFVCDQATTAYNEAII